MTVARAGVRDLATWLGLFVGAMLLLQTGTPPQSVALCLVVITVTALASLRWSIGPLALAILLIVGIYLRVDLRGLAYSDVLNVKRAALDALIAGIDPYGRGFDVSVPPGAPFAYGPLALLWYLPVRSHPVDLELLVSGIILAALALRGRVFGTALYAVLPPLYVSAADGSNDTSAGLLILVALLVAVRSPRFGAVLLALATAFKPYALAWLVPLAAYGGALVFIPFLIATAATWGPALIAFGPNEMLRSFRSAENVHQTPYYALAYAVQKWIKGVSESTWSTFRYLAGAVTALGTIPLVRTSRSFILAGVAIFLATLFLGYWTTFAYVAAFAPILCWYVDDWIGLPRVVWPGDPIGSLTARIDARWPILRPAAPVLSLEPSEAPGGSWAD